MSVVAAAQRLYRSNSAPFHAPGPRGNFLSGSTIAFQKDPIAFLSGVADEYGPVAKFRVLTDDWYLLTAPEDVYQVLVRQASRFHKPRLNKRLFSDFMGNGLVSSDGEHWKRQHKMVLPGFHRRRIDSFGDLMVSLTSEALDAWEQGDVVDINRELTDLTLRIIIRTMFGAEVGDGGQRIRDAMAELNAVLVDYINLPIPVPLWWPSKKNKRKVRAIRDVEDVLFEIVNERRASGEDKGDLLSMMLQMRDDEEKGMSDKDLRDEGMTLFFAGHETASHSMTWIWHLLAEHPDAAEKVAVEIDTVLGDEPMTMASLKELPYLEMVVKEGMRLYGAAWMFMREPVEDVSLPNVRIPAGAQVAICPHILHRRPNLFEDPEAFRPERFTKENEAKIPMGAYVPFSMGPRVCLGKTFAMAEMRLILGTILRRFRPVSPPGFVPKPVAQISLHPAEGMLNVVERRGSR
jgi:cytochrome P450